MLQRLQRRLLWVTLLLAGLAALLVWAGGENGRAARWLDDWLNEPHRMAVAAGHRVGIVAGHMGYDSGALCEDGLTEAEVVAEIAQRVVQRLRRAGASVDLLAEYDDRLNGYAADVLVSIHADSCQVERSGFKVVHAQPSAIPAAEDRLVACLRQHYADITGLAFDEATITAGMTEYHAFKRVSPSTAAAIIETGFLSGDRELLSLQPDLVARGIVDGVICYLEDRWTAFAGSRNLPTATNVASDSLRMTVRNVAPLVDAGPDQQATVGMVLDFAGSFADPGLLDTHTVQWDFGDGNTASGALALLVTLWLLRR